MARSKELKVVIVGDADKLNRELRKSSNNLDKFGKQTRLTGTVSSRGFAAMRVGAVGATAAVGGLALAGKRVIDTASDIDESLSKNRVLFGRYAKGIDTFSRTTATSLGISRAAALESTGTFGNLFTALEIGPKKSAGMSVALVKLAADMASFNNASPEETLDAIRSGLVGETEPLRRFGVNLNDATLRTEALRMGLVKTTKESLEPQTRALAVNSLLFKQTGKAQGDFARTSGGAANQQKILNAQFQDAQAKLGDMLLPTFTKGITKVNKFVGEMQSGTGAGGEFVDTLEDIWTETKPIVTWIGRATANVAGFVKEHPNVGKLALAIAGVGLAVKGLKFVSAATGFTDLLKAGRTAATGLKRILARGGTAAGTAAAENMAASAGSNLGPSLDRHQKKFSGGRWSSLGKKAGKSFGIAAAAAAVFHFREDINSFFRDFRESKVGSKLLAPSKWGEELGKAFGDLIGTNKNSGGIIPGQGNRDTVPAMLTPGEFVIRKQVVEKFGPTFFAAINAGKAPQKFTSGGIIKRANAIDAKDYPYVWGGGHGRTGVPSGGTGRDPGIGYDCSGAVSAILGVSPPRVSGGFTSWGKPGPGSPNDTKVYANAEHVFAVLNGRGWGTSRENPGGGPGWLSYNHRPGFVIRHIDDGHLKGKGGGERGDPGESNPDSGATTRDLAEKRRERAARAGSRLVNSIAGATLKGTSKDVRAQRSIGQVIEDAEGGYGRSERFFGQVIGGQPGRFGEEDLGTAEGRTARISELGELRKLKTQQLARMRKRAAALKRLVAKYEKALKQMNRARGKARGAKRAKISERMKAYDDRLVEYKAELRSLGESIADTQLDIGDLTKDIQEVAATPNTEAEAAPSAADVLSQTLGDIDAQERAGLLTAEQAKAGRISYLQRAMAGEFGALSQRELWDVMGQLKEIQEQAVQVVADNTSALRDLQKEIALSNAIANSTVGIQLREATRALGDLVGGELGGRVHSRQSMPGSGSLARL